MMKSKFPQIIFHKKRVSFPNYLENIKIGNNWTDFFAVRQNPFFTEHLFTSKGTLGFREHSLDSTTTENQICLVKSQIFSLLKKGNFIFFSLLNYILTFIGSYLPVIYKRKKYLDMFSHHLHDHFVFWTSF